METTPNTSITQTQESIDERQMDGDALKKLAINHVEKVVLGAVIAIFGLLIYNGLKIEPFAEAKNPENLKDTATQVMSQLQDNHWEAIKDEEDRLFEVKYKSDVDKSRDPIDPGLTFNVYGPPKSRASVKRRDPDIKAPQYAPQEIQLTGVLGALAYIPPESISSPYDDLEAAPALELEEEKKPRPKKKIRRPRGGGGEGSGMMMEEMGAGLEMAMPSEGSPEMMGMAGGGLARQLDPKYDRGFRGAGMGSTGMMVEGSPMASPNGQGAQRPIPWTHHFIAGTAVMPDELLNDEFQSALADAKGFDPRRDRPRYMYFRVIRADVTDRSVEDLEEPNEDKILAKQGDWLETTNTGTLNKYMRNWAGAAQEVISPEYIDPILTTPIPPLLMQDYMRFVGHQLVPWAGQKKDGSKTEVKEDVKEEAVPQGPAIGNRLDIDALQGNRPPVGGQRPGMGAGMEMGMGAGMEMGMGSGMEMGMGAGMEMGMGAGMEMGMGSGMGMGMGSTVVIASEYKLIRFYDFRDKPSVNEHAPQPGRRYVYRIQVAIEDPNYPVNARFAPALKTLDSEALDRVQRRIADDKQLAEKDGRPYRTGYIWSAWSEPSPPASLPEVRWFVGGQTEPETTTNLGDKTIVKTPASSNVVAVNWDFRYATERTADFEKATIGTVLYKGQFTDEIVNPSNKEIKTLENASVKTGGMILDISGGDPLAVMVDEEEAMLAPGKTLVFDPEGGLQVRHEIEDAFLYRKYTFADERERLQKQQSATNTMSPGEEMYMNDSIFGE
ncbi:MAG: hypothetical protein R3C05_04015 [Pirellulaceae bacterium]